MITSQHTLRNLILKELPKDSWINLLEIYRIVEANIGDFKSGDFEPLADYNQQERWKRNVRNALQTLKRKGQIQWDGKANYYLGNHSDSVKNLPTGEELIGYLINDEKLYIKRAKIAFPILVRQAKADKTIYYSDLAKEMGMPNARNLNFVLGAIGDSLKDLENNTGKEIPLLNCLVVNKGNEMPSSGVDKFIEQKNFDSLNKSDKKKIVHKILSDIFIYRNWYWVLSELGLEPLETNFDQKIKEPKPYYGAGGESQEHKDFKTFIARNPNIFNLPSKLEGVTEYELPSMDLIDVVFKDEDEIVGIEVKSYISNSADIQRGIFQCVKYKALLEAEQIVNDLTPNCRVILALESQLPNNLIPVTNQLGIEVYEHQSEKKCGITTNKRNAYLPSE